MISIKDFYKQMIIFFLKIEKEIVERIQGFYRGLDTIIVEDVIMPEVIDLLKKNREVDKLKDIFEYFEMVSTDADDKLLNTFSVTTLEILGNEQSVLKTAKQYMGPVTTMLQREADLGLGRVVE